MRTFLLLKVFYSFMLFIFLYEKFKKLLSNNLRLLTIPPKAYTHKNRMSGCPGILHFCTSPFFLHTHIMHSTVILWYLLSGTLQVFILVKCDDFLFYTFFIPFGTCSSLQAAALQVDIGIGIYLYKQY